MKICLLALSRIADDPRVRRQGDALADAGHEVVGIGLTGAVAPPPRWPVIELAPSAQTKRRRLTTAARVALARLHPAVASAAYWAPGRHRAILDAARSVRADVYHANDWDTLPVAARAAAEGGGRYVYDSHEYAQEQLVHDRAWRMLFPPFIRAIEDRHVRGAAFVCTVGEGIAHLLQRDYGLTRLPVVIRNVPRYQEVQPVLGGRDVTVLYQGALNKNRGLETLIDSVRLWDPRFRLVIRGVGAPEYRDQLVRRAARRQLEGRVDFVSPVAMTDLVTAASKADIGIHPIPASSNQTRLCLPNKFFEYVMAGLALCVTEAPEMKALVERYRLGSLITTITPEGIADSINGLSAEAITEARANSLTAAKELCWECEKTRLLREYENMLS